MKYLLLLAFTLAVKFSPAHNLIFNQIILIDGSQAFSQAVPAGYVWEIVSATSMDDTSYVYRPEITINNRSVPLTTSAGTALITALPIWLPANTVISNYGFCVNGGGCTPGFISIIEYQVQ